MSEQRERTEQEREAARLERARQRAEPMPYEAAPDSDDGSYEDEEEDLAFREGDVELPVGTKRVSRLERQGPKSARTHVRRRAAPTRAPARQQRSPRRVAPRSPLRRGLVRAVSVLALILGVALIWFLVKLLEPFHGSGHGRVSVTIPAHSTASQIGDLLAREGVVSSSFFFGLRATLAGDRSDLRSGTYHLRLGMSYGEVLSALTTPPKAAKTSNLTIAEGDTRAKVARLLRAQHVRGNYLAATRRSRLIKTAAYGAPRSLRSLEGFLFPSTYQLLDPPTVKALVADQLRTFKQRFATVSLSYARSRHLTPFNVLTIASMVQGEAQTLHDMPLIASVIYNRLHDGMLLGIDATTRYATGNFKTPLTQSQLRSKSPYNTRVHPGLPPGPIDNPGLAAIRAAAHPAHTSYLYFVAKACGNGSSAFESNYVRFQQDVQRYQTARSARGGKSPTHC